METLDELIQFLDLNKRIDLKAVSLTHVLGLTGSLDGKRLLFENTNALEAIISMTDDKTITLAKDAVLCLVNLTADEEGAIKVFQASKCASHGETEAIKIISSAINSICDDNSESGDPWTMVLCNLTRVESLVNPILDEFEKVERSLLMLVKAFCNVNYNRKAKLHYLGPMFCNLTQSFRGRHLFCNPNQNLLQRIACFVNFEDSLIRRGGVIGTLKNICFDPAHHELILDDEKGQLHCLLFPLAGSEEFTEAENETFPMELQYLDILGEKKKREEDPDLRKMLLESLLQLCSTKKSREYLRSKGTYEILREYHKWEAITGGDRDALLVCEKVVDILIKKEDEIGVNNLKEIEVPNDLKQKFEDDDQEYLEDK